MSEKSEERLMMEIEASDLGIQGNIPGFRDSTLARKIEEAKGQAATPPPAADKVYESTPVSADDKILVGVNACKGLFGLAGLVFKSGEDIILPAAAMKSRNIDARIAHAKKLGMIK